MRALSDVENTATVERLEFERSLSEVIVGVDRGQLSVVEVAAQRQQLKSSTTHGDRGSGS
jgi:hypothetical protein